jgi:hypothetical protein
MLIKRFRRAQSPYVLSLPMQVELCMKRGFQRLRGDMAILITSVLFNTVMALVIGSVFYNLEDNTTALYSRSVLLYFAILLAAFASGMEVGQCRMSFEEHSCSLKADPGPLRPTSYCGKTCSLRFLPPFCGSHR